MNLVILAGILIFSFIIFLYKVLLWTWLWQLKEYHWGRLKAHFKTKKMGFFNKMDLLRAPLIILVALYPEMVSIVVFLFLLIEVALVGLRLWRKQWRFPVITAKTLLILLDSIVGIVVVIGLCLMFRPQLVLPLTLSSLVFASLFVSLSVLFLHPFIRLWQKRLMRKARKKRESLNDLLVVGITGSYGKSTVKEFLSGMLDSKYKVLKTPKNINSEVGIAKVILKELDDTYDVFVCEMGAYERGKIDEVAKMVQPTIGVLTGINEQHMATFGSQRDIVEGKFELLRNLPSGALAVINHDSKEIRKNEHRLEEMGLRLKRCAMDRAADFRAEGLDVKKKSLSFYIRGDERVVPIGVSVVGKQSVMNILLAACVANELGVDLREISDLANRLVTPESGMRLVEKDGYTVIDDTYSANSHGVMAAIDYLKAYDGKKIMIMPGIMDLGESSEEVHRRLGRKMGEVCDLVIITRDDHYTEMKEGAMEAGMSNVVLLNDADKIIERVEPLLEEGSILLLEEARIPEKVKKRFL